MSNKMTKKSTKVGIRTSLIVLAVFLIALSGVGLGLVLNKKKPSNPTAKVNPLEWSVDKWDGSAKQEDYLENYAQRENSFTINSASGLAYFRDEVNSGRTFAGYTIYLNTNIDLAGQEFGCIGNELHKFSGTFDGGYYTIRNGKIDGNGLFGCTDGATIKNLGLYNVSVNSESENVGGLVAKALNTDVENCFVRLGQIKGSNTAGGLVGKFESTNAVHSIKNSFVHADVAGMWSASLVGKIETSGTGNVEISNSYYTADSAYYAGDAEKITLTNVVKATRLSDLDVLEGDWRVYSHKKDSEKLDFAYPLLYGYIKVFNTGSSYENVVVREDGTVENSFSLQKSINEGSYNTKIEILVEKVYLAQTTIEDKNVTISASRNTEIVRDDKNFGSVFVVDLGSTLTLGKIDAAESEPTITISGNKDGVEYSRTESGALIVDKTQSIKIGNNVILKDNINNLTGLGGAVYFDNAGTDNVPVVNAKIQNCHAENGGAIFAYNTNVTIGGEISNCSATGNGGAYAYYDELDSKYKTNFEKLYGRSSIDLLASEFRPSEEIFTLTFDSNGELHDCNAENGGALYINSLSNTKGMILFSEGEGFANYHIYNCIASNAGGAIYADCWELFIGSTEYDFGYVNGGSVTINNCYSGLNPGLGHAIYVVNTNYYGGNLTIHESIGRMEIGTGNYAGNGSIVYCEGCSLDNTFITSDKYQNNEVVEHTCLMVEPDPYDDSDIHNVVLGSTGGGTGGEIINNQGEVNGTAVYIGPNVSSFSSDGLTITGFKYGIDNSAGAVTIDESTIAFDGNTVNVYTGAGSGSGSEAAKILANYSNAKPGYAISGYKQNINIEGLDTVVSGVSSENQGTFNVENDNSVLIAFDIYREDWSSLGSVFDFQLGSYDFCVQEVDYSGNGDPNSYRVLIDTGGMQMWCVEPTFTVLSSGWHKIIIVVENNKFSLYVDGTAKISKEDMYWISLTNSSVTAGITPHSSTVGEILYSSNTGLVETALALGTVDEYTPIVASVPAGTTTTISEIVADKNYTISFSMYSANYTSSSSITFQASNNSCYLDDFLIDSTGIVSASYPNTYSSSINITSLLPGWHKITVTVKSYPGEHYDDYGCYAHDISLYLDGILISTNTAQDYAGESPSISADGYQIQTSSDITVENVYFIKKYLELNDGYAENYFGTGLVGGLSYDYYDGSFNDGTTTYYTEQYTYIEHVTSENTSVDGIVMSVYLDSSNAGQTLLTDFSGYIHINTDAVLFQGNTVASYNLTTGWHNVIMVGNAVYIDRVKVATTEGLATCIRGSFSGKVKNISYINSSNLDAYKTYLQTQASNTDKMIVGSKYFYESSASPTKNYSREWSRSVNVFAKYSETAEYELYQTSTATFTDESFGNAGLGGNTFLPASSTVTVPSGYKFDGWKIRQTSPTGTVIGTYLPTDSVTLESAENCAETNYYLEPVFSLDIARYAITLNTNAKNVTCGYSTVYAQTNSKNLYTTSDVSNLTTISALAPTKPSATFLGWFTQASGGTKVIDANATVLLNAYTATSGTTLYAHWSYSDVSLPATSSSSNWRTMVNSLTGQAYDAWTKLSFATTAPSGYTTYKGLINNTIEVYTTSTATEIALVWGGKIQMPTTASSSTSSSSYYGDYAFGNCKKLTTLDLSNLYTDNMTSMGYMFYNCSNLKSLDLSNFNTSSVTYMSRMFHTCQALTSLNVSNFNTSSVTNMNSMFASCSSLTSLDVSNFVTSSVTDMRCMFYACSKLTSLNVSSFNTTKVTDISEMFRNCSSLTSLNVSNFNTGNVTNMKFMFNYCSALTSLDLSNFNTSSVTDMSFMFSNCTSLTSLELSSFNTSKVTTMSYMFSDCKALTSLDLSNFNTSKVTIMESMFGNCSSLTSLDLSSFNTTSVTNMYYMFYGCLKLTSLDFSSFDMTNVTNVGRMFNGCSALATIKAPYNVTSSYPIDLPKTYYTASGDSHTQITSSNCSASATNTTIFYSNVATLPYTSSSNNWRVTVGNLTGVTYESWTKLSFELTVPDGYTNYKGLIDSKLGVYTTATASEIAIVYNGLIMMPSTTGSSGDGAFAGCKALTTLNLNNFYTNNMTDMSYMFQNCNALTSIDLSKFKTNNVRSMSYMFSLTYNSNVLSSITFGSNFNTTSVTDMSYMFLNCSSLTSLDLSNFNTSSVQSMSYMFANCKALTNLNLSNFNTSSVKSMFHMFQNCGSLTTLDLSSFNTSNVTSMSGMFYSNAFNSSNNYSKLQNIIFGTNFITSNVISMSNMFGYLNISALDLSGFNTSNVQSMESMFEKCRSLTSLNVSSFNTTKVTNMMSMFDGCSSLTSLDLSSFNTSNVTNMSHMFLGCSALTSLDVSSFNTSKVTSMFNMFRNCGSLTSLNLSNFNTTSVTDMSYMFAGSTSLTSLDLSNFDMTNATTVSDMLTGCSKLEEIKAPYNVTSSIGLPGSFLSLKAGATTNLITSSNCSTESEPSVFIKASVLPTTWRNNVNTLTGQAYDAWTKLTFATTAPSGYTTLKGSFDESGNTATNASKIFKVYTTSTATEIAIVCANRIEMPSTTGSSGSYAFYHCDKLTTLNLSNLYTDIMTDMSAMFYNCPSLTSLDLSNFNTIKVTNMGYMFWNCSSLTSLDLSNFNTNSVTGMSRMFSSCSSLTSLDLSNFVTSKVPNMDSMFSSCSSLTSLDLSSFNTSSVTYMGDMFSGCSSLTTLDLSSFDMTKVTYVDDMFTGCSALEEIKAPYNVTSSIRLRATFLSLKAGATTSSITSSNCSTSTEASVFTKCYVLLDANGGSCDKTYLLLNSNGTIKEELPTATKDNHTLLGWFTSATGGTKITSTTVLTLGSTIYAHWKINNVTVTFNANGGGTPSFSSREYQIGGTYGELPTISRTGYNFLGWFTSATGGTEITVTSTVSESNTTLYAHWQAIATTISASPTSASKTYGYSQFDVATITAGGGGGKWTYSLVDTDSHFALSTTAATTGSVKLTFTAGANAGTYTCKVKATSSYNSTYAITDTITVTINKADMAINLSTTGTINATYPNNATNSVTSSHGGTLSVASSDTSVATVAINGANITVTPKKSGSVTITVTCAETTNYNLATTSFKVEFANGTISYSSSGYTGTYDQQAHGITVTSSTPGATIKFGTVNGSYNLTESPTYTDQGSYTVYYQITATSYNTVTASETVVINRKDITDAVVTLGDSLTYNGSTQTQTVSSVALTGYTNLTYTVSNNTGKNAGNYTLTVSGTGNYSGSVTKQFSIAKYNLSNAVIESVSDKPYTGSAICPEPSVTALGTTLIKGTDFSYSYSNNTNAGTAKITITALANTNYTGSKETTFTITKVAGSYSVSDKTVTYNGSAHGIGQATSVVGGTVEYSIDNTNWSTTIPTKTDAGTYTIYTRLNPDSNHTAISKQVTLTINPSKTASYTVATNLVYTGSELTGVSGTNVTITGVYKSTNAQTGITAYVEPAKNYAWSDGTTTKKTVTWDIARATVSVPSQSGTLTYNGKTQSPAWNNYNASQLTIGGETSGINANSYTATFTPTSNYAWSDKTFVSKDVNWTINKLSISVPTNATTETYVYDGTEKTYTPANWSTISGYVDISNNKRTDAGSQQVSFSLKDVNNYQWNEQLPTLILTITRAPISVPYQSVDLTFNRKEQSPTWANYDANKMTKSGSELETNAGTYSVTFTPTSNYAWSDKTFVGKSVDWTIQAFNLANATIASVDNQRYTGNPICPKPSVTALGTTLIEGTDFSYSYSNNTNAGTATVTATGKNNYTGTISTNFTINKLYTISYEFNGGTGSTSSYTTEYTVDDTVTLPTTNLPTRAGHVFAGWFSDSALTQKVTSISKGSTGNKTIYAGWKLNITLNKVYNASHVTFTNTAYFTADGTNVADKVVGANYSLGLHSDLQSKLVDTITYYEIANLYHNYSESGENSSLLSEVYSDSNTEMTVHVVGVKGSVIEKPAIFNELPDNIENIKLTIVYTEAQKTAITVKTDVTDSNIQQLIKINESDTTKVTDDTIDNPSYEVVGNNVTFTVDTTVLSSEHVYVGLICGGTAIEPSSSTSSVKCVANKDNIYTYQVPIDTKVEDVQVFIATKVEIYTAGEATDPIIEFVSNDGFVKKIELSGGNYILYKATWTVSGVSKSLLQSYIDEGKLTIGANYVITAVGSSSCKITIS